MNKDLILHMQSQFDELAKPHPDEPSVEFWFTRELRDPLGYARWENFLTAIQRAIESCNTTGYDPDHHIRGVTNMVVCGKRWVSDRFATRYVAKPIVAACTATAGKSPAARTKWRSLP